MMMINYNTTHYYRTGIDSTVARRTKPQLEEEAAKRRRAPMAAAANQPLIARRVAILAGELPPDLQLPGRGIRNVWITFRVETVRRPVVPSCATAC